jgi:hypothetical protein
VKFSVRPSILLNNKECSPLGERRGHFTSSGQVHPWGPGVKIRMGDQIGLLFSLGTFRKILPKFLGYFFPRHIHIRNALILTKIGWSSFGGEFFADSSGHPESFYIARKIKNITPIEKI